MTCNKRLEAYLREQQVPYEVQHHRTTYTTHDTAVTEHIPDALMMMADSFRSLSFFESAASRT